MTEKYKEIFNDQTLSWKDRIDLAGETAKKEIERRAYNIELNNIFIKAMINNERYLNTYNKYIRET